MQNLAMASEVAELMLKLRPNLLMSLITSNERLSVQIGHAVKKLSLVSSGNPAPVAVPDVVVDVPVVVPQRRRPASDTSEAAYQRKEEYFP